MPAQTPLAVAIVDPAAVSLTVTDVLGFPASGAYTIAIDAEWLRVTAGAGTTTWTVTRGYSGTTGATHLILAPVTLIDESYATLGGVRARLGIATADTTSDALLATLCGQINAFVEMRLGGTIGPSAVTTLLLDGCNALQYARRLYVPTGIRTLTKVETAPGTGAAFTEVTLATVIKGPWLRPAGHPYTQLDLAETASLRWPWGYANVRLTGTFGWDAIPADLVGVAESATVRAFKRRQAGEADAVAGMDGPQFIGANFRKSDLEVLDSYAFGLTPVL